MLRSRIFIWLGCSVLAACIGWAYSQTSGGNVHIGMATGLLIGASILGLELFVVHRPIGAPIRRLPLPIFLIVSSIAWVLIIYTVLVSVTPLLTTEQAYGDDYTATSLRQDLVFALIVSLVFNAALRVRSLAGSRVLLNFLLGRYHRPLRESRIFMFLDVAESTKLAEQLGDEQVQSLIGRFFFDIATPIAHYGGETHRYIGDEVVVTWTLARGQRQANCLECVRAISRLMHEQETVYQKRFGVVPRFRAGLHCGEVVAGEVGDDKREIVYFGDTINTTARIAAYCKDTGKDLLVSQALLNHVDLPKGVVIHSLGPVQLRGKRDAIEVVSLSFPD